MYGWWGHRRPYYTLGDGREITILLRDYNAFVYSSLCDHESFYLDFEFIITGSTDVIAVMESVFVYKLSVCSWVWACW